MKELAEFLKELIKSTSKLFIFFGLVLILLSFSRLDKIITILDEYRIVSFSLGALLLLIGLFLEKQSWAVIVFAGVSLLVIFMMSLSSPFSPHSETLTPTIAPPIATPSPTAATPSPSADTSVDPMPTVPPTLTPLPVLPPSTLTPAPAPTTAIGGGNCFAADVWSPHLGVAAPLNVGGCWQLDNHGLFPHDNLTLSLQNIPAGKFYGLYRPIPLTGVIDFTIQIDELQTYGDQDGNITIAIIHSDLPDPNLGISLLFQVETSPPNFSPVRLKIHERNQLEVYVPDLPVYEFGRAYHFTLALSSGTLTIDMDGEPIGSPISIPFTERSLWIGYQLPGGTSLAATLSDLTIILAE